MQESAQSAKIFGTPPERGHSCPQQLPDTQQDRSVRELYFRSTLLRTGMSALRFGSGSAGLGTDAPYPPALIDCRRTVFAACAFHELLPKIARIHHYAFSAGDRSALNISRNCWEKASFGQRHERGNRYFGPCDPG